MNNPADKREFPRANIKLQIAVTVDGETESTTLQDLTVGGMSFVFTRPLPEGTEVKTDIRSNHQEIKDTTLMGTVVRNESLGDFHLVAIRFNNPNDRYLMDILAHIHGPNPKI